LVVERTVLEKKLSNKERVERVQPCGVNCIEFGLFPRPELDSLEIMLSVQQSMKELGKALLRLYICGETDSIVCMRQATYCGCKGIWGYATKM